MITLEAHLYNISKEKGRHYVFILTIITKVMQTSYILNIQELGSKNVSQTQAQDWVRAQT